MSSYSWSGPNGFSSSSQNPTIAGATLSMMGTYTLVVVDVNGCTDTTTTYVVVNTCSSPCPPLDPTTIAAIADTICPGDSAMLIASTDVIFGGGGSMMCNQPVDIDRGCSRSMSLLHWSELPSGSSGGTITQIGVYVMTAGPSPTPVNIRMKTVSYSSISCGGHDGYCQCAPSDCCADWDETGTLVYSGMVDYSSTGWTIITLTTPFVWTSNNLLITWDWCETGSGYACVRGTPTTGELAYTQFYDYCSDDVAREAQYGWDGSDWTTCCVNDYLIDSWARVDYKLVFASTLMRTTAISAAPMDDSTYFVWFDGSCGSSLPAAVDTGETIWVSPSATTTYYVRNYNPYYDCWSDSCLSVTVYVDNISANITPSAPELCEGENIGLDGNPSGGYGGYTHQWTGDTGSLSSTTVQNPTFTGTTPGTFNLTYTVTDGYGCQASDTVSIIVHPLPFVYASGNNVCEGGTIFLNAGPPLVSYSWTGPAGFFSSSMDTMIYNATLTNAGWYVFTGTDSYGCSNSDSVFVTVYPSPLANAWNDGAYCVGDDIHLFSSPNGMSSYSWSGPNSFSSSAQNPTIPGAALADSGEYMLIITDTLGCIDTAYTIVTVRECTCPPAETWIECPFPCGNYSSCADQYIIFGIEDTTGVNIDTTRVWFTVIVSHSTGSADTTYLEPGSPLLSFSALSDSITATIYGTWSDGDNVTVILDSLYNIADCLTIP